MGECIRFVDDTDNEAYDEYIGFTRGNVLETFIGKTIRGYDRNSGDSCQEVKLSKKSLSIVIDRDIFYRELTVCFSIEYSWIMITYEDEAF